MPAQPAMVDARPSHRQRTPLAHAIGNTQRSATHCFAVAIVNQYNCGIVRRIWLDCHFVCVISVEGIQ